MLAVTYGQNEERASTVPFPKLMSRIGMRHVVVLFYKKQKGVIVSGDAAHVLGEFSTCWDMRKFEDYDGYVTLTQAD